MVAELEERLVKIQSDFESRVETYERRIAELERELESKSQVNNELLGATIHMAKKALQDVAERQPESSFSARQLAPAGAAEVKAPIRSKADEERFPFGDILARRASSERR
jgi:cytochrome c-type biogenesis protein CcmH/NrfG